MKFKSVLFYVPERTEVSEETQTQPDLSYTVRELFERMVAGLPLCDRVIPTYYDDDEDIDNPDVTTRPGFDLSDYTEEMLKLQEEQQSRVMRESAKANPPSEAKKDEPPQIDGNAKL